MEVYVEGINQKGSFQGSVHSLGADAESIMKASYLN
jgi:hypothetical protein